MGSHRHTHQYHIDNKAANICFQNCHTNVDGGVAAAMQNIESNICLPMNMEESIPKLLYYEMTMDDIRNIHT